MAAIATNAARITKAKHSPAVWMCVYVDMHDAKVSSFMPLDLGAGAHTCECVCVLLEN